MSLPYKFNCGSVSDNLVLMVVVLKIPQKKTENRRFTPLTTSNHLSIYILVILLFGILILVSIGTSFVSLFIPQGSLYYW